MYQFYVANTLSHWAHQINPYLSSPTSFSLRRLRGPLLPFIVKIIAAWPDRQKEPTLVITFWLSPSFVSNSFVRERERKGKKNNTRRKKEPSSFSASVLFLQSRSFVSRRWILFSVQWEGKEGRKGPLREDTSFSHLSDPFALSSRA